MTLSKNGKVDPSSGYLRMQSLSTPAHPCPMSVLAMGFKPHHCTNITASMPQKMIRMHHQKGRSIHNSHWMIATAL
jgi:hypothetical protein